MEGGGGDYGVPPHGIETQYRDHGQQSVSWSSEPAEKWNLGAAQFLKSNEERGNLEGAEERGKCEQQCRYQNALFYEDNGMVASLDP